MINQQIILLLSLGHEWRDCEGLLEEFQKPEPNATMVSTNKQEKAYIFVRLYVLREYLEKELAMPGLPFLYDLERALDDWNFLCFFVGNDFLPHLPSLDLGEGALDVLVRLYKDVVAKTGGWLTDNGDLDFERVQMILNRLGQMEFATFKKRHENRVQPAQRGIKRKAEDEGENEVRLWDGKYKDRYYTAKFSSRTREFKLQVAK